MDVEKALVDAANQAAHPFSAFAGALLSGAMDSGQLNTLNQLALARCHESI
jgi:hypothetical protein